MEIFPRLVASHHHTPFKREAFSSGIAELDALLGGGLDRGTSTMLMGPPGTGKVHPGVALRPSGGGTRREEHDVHF